MEKTRKKHLLLLLLLIGIVVVVVGVGIYETEERGISLEDLRNNPENYLGVREATFTIVRIILRPDPYHRLVEKYYLVYIRDLYGYEAPFVISEADYPKYNTYVGELVLFKLNGTLGPGVMHPPDKLITNILVSKVADPYSREYYTVFITLIGSIDHTPISLRELFLPLAGIGVMIVATATYILIRRK